ncbi:DUF1801 domain-containing protein [Pontibacter sp. HSC-14F20]|uniref:DUF1801 domain-containing protein n=1 Tax=Pontibacter sp. HSC-14F20 TaxID=2864136 RepID=UPI001C734579|nr:DUF1801 domain-containing protein [Pontibacter sp. HSC-14F20]MBX0331792.1 DUF1801 domain-containing protein [Pontibacter sp. HSC-14F20]
MHPQVTDYINASEKHKETLEALRQLLHDTVPGVTEEFKWGRPVFRSSKDFTYLKTAKTYITLGFFHFDKLNDPNGLLEGTGKDMRHIKIKNVQDIDRELLSDWFKAAAV